MKVSPYILLSLTSLFWSFNFVLGKVLSGTIPPATISFLRWVIPLIFFLLVYGNQLKTNANVLMSNWRLIIVLGTTGYCLNSISVYEAVRHTSTINTSFINAFNPVLIAICGFVLYRYPVSLFQGIGFALSFLGVLWIMFEGNITRIIDLEINGGDIFMIASIVFWSFHTVIYKKRASHLPKELMFTAMMAGGVLATIPFVIGETILNQALWIQDIRIIHVLCIFCLNLFPSVLAYRFWHDSLKKVSANQVAIFQYLIPVFTTTISVLFLDEQFRAFHLIGGLFIFLGVILVNNSVSELSRLKRYLMHQLT